MLPMREWSVPGLNRPLTISMGGHSHLILWNVSTSFYAGSNRTKARVLWDDPTTLWSRLVQIFFKRILGTFWLLSLWAISFGFKSPTPPLYGTTVRTSCRYFNRYSLLYNFRGHDNDAKIMNKLLMTCILSHMYVQQIWQWTKSLTSYLVLHGIWRYSSRKPLWPSPKALVGAGGETKSTSW